MRRVHRAGGPPLDRAHADCPPGLCRLPDRCPDCGGTGAVPAGGWEPAETVDNGYVPCPTCTRIVALTTTQGTAMPETALCFEHFQVPEHWAAADAAGWFDQDERGFQNCNDNDELACIICGHPASAS